MLRGIGDRLQGLSRIRRWAAAASLGWAVLVGAYGIGFLSVVGPGRGTVFLDAMFFLVALVLPLLLIWLAAWLAEELERQREIVAALAEVTAPLIGALAATREAVDRHGAGIAGGDPEGGAGRAPRVAAGLFRPARPAARAARRGSRRRCSGWRPHRRRGLRRRSRRSRRRRRWSLPLPRPRRRPRPGEPLLPLLATEEAPARPDWQDLVRALDFPRDADDRAGFRALKVALRHHGLAQMLQAAEDVLNLLSQEGVFVDELPMAPVDTGAWRRFMAGKRGPEVVGVGGISDARALEAARGLMRSDSIFRDSALFFQRRFDGVLSEFCSGATDGQMEELAGTRSGRAFMLMVRLSGSLD